MAPKRTRTNFWLGFLIGLLSALLLATLAILFVPQLRPIVGLDVKNALTENNIENSPGTVPGELAPFSNESENIRVTAPEGYTRITSPVTVRGEARVFENTVIIRLRDEDGRVLAETFTTAQSADVGLFGPLELSLAFDKPTGSQGTLEVFWESPADGSETDIVSIPVYL